MLHQAYIYINYKNIVVLKTYLDVIKEALTQCGYECTYIHSMDNISKKALVVFPMGTDAFKYYLKGYKRIVLWQQGVTGEESYLRNHSKIRRAILNWIDCMVMKKSKMVFYVSKALREYYEKRARCSFVEKSYIMPCYNEKFDSSVFEKKNYSSKTFAYVGSLDLWQCFDKTAEIYASIEKEEQDAFFKVLTFQVEEAERILKEKKVRNYCVKCVDKEKVKEELVDVTYGFIIRDDIVVNRVATPTKFSSYLVAGVLPIFSDCLTEFCEVCNGKQFAYKIDDQNGVYSLLKYIKNEIDSVEVQKEIQDVFFTYYSTEEHVKRIVELAERCVC